MQSTTTGAITATYAYNADGQTTSRPGPTAQQTLTWNVEGDLATVTEASLVTSNIYDAGGTLLISHGPSGVTLYLGGQQITRSTAGVLTAQREIDLGGQPVAVRTNTGLSWLIGDPHGTATLAIDAATLAIDAATQALTHRYETPFGTVRGTVPTAWPDANGFLGKPDDPDTGLTYLGAREYDPAIGRFLSVDPILDDTDAQSLAAYTYADNTPLVASDPSGQILDGGYGSGSSCNAKCHRQRNKIYRQARIDAARKARRDARRAAARERAMRRWEQAQTRSHEQASRYRDHHNDARVAAVAAEYTHELLIQLAERNQVLENMNAVGHKAYFRKSRVGRFLKKIYDREDVQRLQEAVESKAMKIAGRFTAGLNWGVSFQEYYAENKEEHGTKSAIIESAIQATNDTALKAYGAIEGGGGGEILGSAVEPGGGTVVGGVAGSLGGMWLGGLAAKRINHVIGSVWRW